MLRDGKSNSDEELDLEPNSKPYLLKRIISDGFDTVSVFILFIVFSALIFSSPLAGTYNTHAENCRKARESAIAEYGDDEKAIENFLQSDEYYRNEDFSASSCSPEPLRRLYCCSPSRCYPGRE